MVVSDLGSLIVVRFEQALNAWKPRFVTPSGMTMPVNADVNCRQQLPNSVTVPS